MNKADQMRKFVLNHYLETQKHVFVSDVMQQFATSAANVRNALGYDDFIFDEDSRWTGTNYSGRYVTAPCIEPSKTYLARLLYGAMLCGATA